MKTLQIIELKRENWGWGRKSEGGERKGERGKELYKEKQKGRKGWGKRSKGKKEKVGKEAIKEREKKEEEDRKEKMQSERKDKEE